jgi:hypothetical protein
MSVIPPTLQEVERTTEGFQRMLDLARERRERKELRERRERKEKEAMVDTKGRYLVPEDDNEPLIDESHLTEDAPPLPALLAGPTPPAERAGAALSEIEQGALRMAEEARAAATAVEIIAKMIRADAEAYAGEVTKLSGKYCARVADYLRQCHDIQASFQLKKEDMIKRAQALGPILEDSQPSPA